MIWDWFCSGYGGYANGGAAKQPNTGNVLNVTIFIYLWLFKFKLIIQYIITVCKIFFPIFYFF